MSGLTHGSHARVGDYVQLINPAGALCDIYGLVYKVERSEAVDGFWYNRYLYVHGQPHRIKDCYANIISHTPREES